MITFHNLGFQGAGSVRRFFFGSPPQFRTFSKTEPITRTPYEPMTETFSCRVCTSHNTTDFLAIRNVPVHCNLLWPSESEAKNAPRGDLRLSFCNDCGHIYNTAFDPALMEYTQAYENSLHFSPSFQQFAEGLASRLIQQYDLRGKDVIDIGCGKGDFLKLICALGKNRGVGFDPSYVPDDADQSANVKFVQEFYSEKHKTYSADFASCRHVLEHIQYPVNFVETIGSSIGDRKTVLYVEVPNVLYTLRDSGIWDLIYEHCSYFSPGSISTLFRQTGFSVLNVTEEYGKQFLGLEAVRGKTESPGRDIGDLPGLAGLVRNFGETYRSKVTFWKDTFASLNKSGNTAVVWGGGSKGVTFLNTVPTEGAVYYMVDINPRKQGMYVAGTGQKVVSPAFLRSIDPDTVIVMNPIYVEEIRTTLAGLGLSPRLLLA